MTRLSGKYVFAPVEVFSDHRLGLIELRVLLALYSFRNKDSNEVFPSRESIAARSGYGKTTVSRAVSKLVNYGWLKVKQHRGPNTYSLKMDGTVTDLETVTDSETVSNQETVTNPGINSDRFGQETVTGSATPELTNNKPIELKKAKPPVPPCPHSEIIDLYHEILPELQTVTKSRWKGSQREKNLLARWREDERHQTLGFWERFFDTVKTNPHWLGKNGWRANLGWLIERKNFDKVIDRAVDHQRRATS